MRFLVVTDTIGTGGISSAFKGFINRLSKEADCDVLIFNDIDVPADILPANVQMLKADNALHLLGMSQKRISEESRLLAAARLFMVFMAKAINGSTARKIVLNFTKGLKGYDAAISYTQDVNYHSLARGCNDFVIRKVDAKLKCAFIHCDYKEYGGYNPRQEKLYGSFDYILGVSKGCCDSFISCFPALADKVLVSENFINTEDIILKSKEFVHKKADALNIVTVCRLSREKGIQRALRVFSKLLDKYDNFKWIIVGGGAELEEDISLAAQLGLEDYVEFAGEQKNPFPYIKDADLFLLPSFHEAAPMVFGECQTLGIPIITTATSSAKELVEQKNIGFVCDNTEAGIYSLLDSFLSGALTFSATGIAEAETRVNENAEKQFCNFIKRIEVKIND